MTDPKLPKPLLDLDERTQVWSALHIKGALAVLVGMLVALGWWAFR